MEPREGYPTKVDREYLVVQSEFYAKPDADGRNVDGRRSMYSTMSVSTPRNLPTQYSTGRTTAW